MEEYWGMISNEHQERLRILAEKSGIDPDTALKNIINCLQGKNPAEDGVCYIHPNSSNQIEEMIDTLTT